LSRLDIACALVMLAVACTPPASPVIVNRASSGCDPTGVIGSIVDLDNRGAPAAYATVSATGGDDRRVISRSGDVPLFAFKDEVTTDAQGSFAFHGLDPARHGLAVAYLANDRMLEFVGAIPNARCESVRFGIHGRADNADQKPLPLIRLTR
jgi:hypothetical protein